MAPAPSKAKAGNTMKQKSLTSFFAKPPKPPGSTVKAAPLSLKGSEAHDAHTSPVKKSNPSTPDSKLIDETAANLFTLPSSQSSNLGSSVKDTPPTSDPVDVDMLSDDGDANERVRTGSGRGKRKVVVDESDSDGVFDKRMNNESTRYKENCSQAHDDNSTFKKRLKKRRVSAVFSDEDKQEDEQEDNDAMASFSKRLTHFKKSPRKKRSSSSVVTDDDDFIVPSDSDVESGRRSSSRASSRRSASSTDKDFMDDEEDENAERPKKKSQSARRPPLKKGGTANSSNNSGSLLFLTAAEQREQGKKDEKKKTDDPFSFLQDIRDKDGVRPGQPGYDPRTLYIPKSAWAEFTPFEKQFWEIKQSHYDTVLFFQKGKFLELYEDDARIGHQQFDLKLTQRVKMSMVGVPEMSFNFWAAKFLAKGYKVGRVDQAETALGAEMRLAADKSKGRSVKAEDKGKEKIVRRELNKVYTNGTLVDEELLIDEQAGHCVSIREEQNGGTSSFGVCVLDSATSEFNLSAFEDDICCTKMETLVRQLRIKELLFTKGNLSVETTRLLKAVLPASCLWTSLRDCEGLKYGETIKQLRTMFAGDGDGDDDMDEDDGTLGNNVPNSIKGMAGEKNAIEALGSMIWYLRQLNIDKDILTMKNFNIYDPMKKGQGLVLDGQTLAHIEVLLNNEGTEEGTLLKLLSRCATPFGKRLFRIWLCMPLREISDINARLDAVCNLMDHPEFETEFTKLAKGLSDLERIVSRIHAKNCKVKDFLKVLAAFRKLNRGLRQLATLSEDFESKTIFGLLRSAPDLLPNIAHIEEMYRKAPDGEKDLSELLPESGKHEGYDNIMAEIKDLEQKLENERKKLQTETGCTLTYWHSAQGNKEIYLVQTKPSEKHIPRNWIKSNSTKAAVRWVVPALQPLIRSLKEARENRNTAIRDFKLLVFAEFDLDRALWLRAVRVLAELDCLSSLARASAALGEPACRPEFVEGACAAIDFEELRHPVLAARAGVDGFIPNDVKLDRDVGRIALLTGPNMGGKSTVMRMTAVGVIMAQLGMLVPAKRARLCPVDSILTRMGAYDNMFSQASTFKVELDECCKILRDATPKSLVIMDELGRGTSTYDGMAIAGAVLHQLATHTLPLSFFATHYGSLTDDFAYHPNVRNMHMATLVDDEKQQLVFLYKLVRGVAPSSFGTHVAALAGVPADVVSRAATISTDFAAQFAERMAGRRGGRAGKGARGGAWVPLEIQADFAFLWGVTTGKVALGLDGTGRVRAQEALAVLQRVARRYGQRAGDSEQNRKGV